jgi:uncharacterized protein YbaR (Trm112 family)
MNKSWFIDSPFFSFLKKHYCPCCKGQLVLKKAKRIIDPVSDEAKNYDFSCGDSYLTGKVEFHFFLFYCKTCKREYLVREIKELEYKKKRTKDEETN